MEDPQVAELRVAELSQRWYSFGAKVGRLRLAEIMVTPWAQTEAKRQDAPAVINATVRETKEWPGGRVQENVVKGGSVIQRGHVATRRSYLGHSRHRIHRKMDPLASLIERPRVVNQARLRWFN